mmetsp:Transcript_19045/g.34448  ORF Transcript_19045/g.34448 Transcript_19045/m.34448 type:complete len:126 (-) Transcript_19045:110-487(-)
MLGLLRMSMRSSCSGMNRATAPLAKAPTSCLPFVPTDWVFRFFPYMTRDKVRFFYRFNQISFAMGFLYVYLWAHVPYAGADYDHVPTWPLYRWTYANLERTGQLEENLRIKVHHFYPQTAEAEEE